MTAEATIHRVESERFCIGCRTHLADGERFIHPTTDKPHNVEGCTAVYCVPCFFGEVSR